MLAQHNRATEAFLARELMNASEQYETDAIAAIGDLNARADADASRHAIRDPLFFTILTATARWDAGFDDSTRERCAIALASARDRLRADYEAGRLPVPLRNALQASIDRAETWVDAIHAQWRSFGDSITAQYGLSDAVARVMLMFPPRREWRRVRWRVQVVRRVPSEPVQAAHDSTNAFAAAAALVGDETGAGRNPSDRVEDFNAELGKAGAAIGNFAASASAYARRLWL